MIQIDSAELRIDDLMRFFEGTDTNFVLSGEWNPRQLLLFAGIERRFERLCHFLLDWLTSHLGFQEQKSSS